MSQVHGTWPLVSFKANATTAAYVIVSVTGANQVGLHATSTSLAVGVTQQASQAGTNSSVLVALLGCAKVTAGASVAAGAIVMPQTATGYAITRDTTTSKAIGVALDAGDTNSVIEVFLTPDLH